MQSSLRHFPHYQGFHSGHSPFGTQYHQQKWFHRIGLLEESSKEDYIEENAKRRKASATR
jgi:hypothetical protein